MTDNSTPNAPHIPEDDLVLFALQLLPEERMRQARQHLDTCDACRADVARLQGDLVAYSITAEMQDPPPAAREKLMRQVAREPRLAPVEEPAVAVQERAVQARPHQERSGQDRRRQEHSGAEPVFPTRQNRGLRIDTSDDEPEEIKKPARPARAPWVLAWVGWALAAGCAFFAGLQLRQRQQIQSTVADQQARIDQTTRDATHAKDALATLTATNAVQVALHIAAPEKPTPTKPGAAPASPSPEAVAAYLADKGALVFVATHLQPVPAGKTYELWLLPADGRNPMPAGTFKPDPQGAASIVMPPMPKGVPAKGFAVTVENDGGSEVATSPVIMSGT